MAIRGAIDVMVDPWAHIWDFAPCKIIVKEAGGEFANFTGNKARIDVWKRCIRKPQTSESGEKNDSGRKSLKSTPEVRCADDQRNLTEDRANTLYVVPEFSSKDKLPFPSLRERKSTSPYFIPFKIQPLDSSSSVKKLILKTQLM